jgi:hypothetical protein
MRIPVALRWLIGISLPILLLVLLFRWDWLIPMVEARASAALGRPVTIAHLHVRLRRVPEITLTDLRIANPDGFPADPPFALVPRTVIAVEAWPLIRGGQLVVPSVALHQPAFELLGKEDGTNNYTFDALTGDAGGRGAQIRRVSILEGRSHVALEALEADFNLLIATQEPEGQDPTITLRAEGTYAAQPITGELVGGALLALQDATRPWPVRVQLANGQTRVTLEGTVQEPLALRGADLRLTLAGPDMKLLMPLTGVPIPTTPAYRVAGRLDFEGCRWPLRPPARNRNGRRTVRRRSRPRSRAPPSPRHHCPDRHPTAALRRRTPCQPTAVPRARARVPTSRPTSARAAWTSTTSPASSAATRNPVRAMHAPAAPCRTPPSACRASAPPTSTWSMRASASRGATCRSTTSM